MTLKKTLLVTGAVTAVGLAGVAGLGVASAATTTSTQSSSLVDKIAQTFNLNKADVQKVFDDNRAAHQAERQQKIEDHLTQAVKDGKLTDDQKTKILAKLKELEADRTANKNSLKNMSPAERKAAFDAQRADLEKWAADNNIPMQYLRVFGGHGGRGMGGPGPV